MANKRATCLRKSYVRNQLFGWFSCTERFTQNYFTQKPRSMLLFVIEYVNLHVKSLERENCSNFHTLRRKNTRNLRAFDEQARFCRIALDPCSWNDKKSREKIKAKFALVLHGDFKTTRRKKINLTKWTTLILRKGILWMVEKAAHS